MTIKIFALDDCDWWAGESLDACLAEARKECGEGSYCDAEQDGYELSAADMQNLNFREEDGTRRTFADQLALEIAKGTTFPCFFASTEC